MSIDPNQARSLFLAALDKPAHERAAFLAAACAGMDELRLRLDAMLQANENSGELLAGPPGDLLAQDEATEANATAAFAAGQVAPRTDADSTGGDAPSGASAAQAPVGLGRLGHYQTQQVIGKGGFGTVFKAFDEKLHRIVAIKVLSPAFAENGSARKRFIREARAAAAVKNEHVVAIHNVGDEAQPPYLVMELIDGCSLQDKLDKQGALGIKEILRIGMQISEGLAAAHRQGLVHRDIKPANILLENGVERVKITDFGLARAVDDASVTQSGTVAGTPMYMSPEQAEGLPVDHRSDLFSLGTVLYAMCTGHPPFRASGTHAVLKRVIDASPRPLRETNNEVPDWLCVIIAKLHAKKPEERFQTALEVAELLGQHLAHLQQPATAPRPADLQPPPTCGPVQGINLPSRAWRLLTFTFMLAAFGGPLFAILTLLAVLFDIRGWASLLVGAGLLAISAIAVLLRYRRVRRTHPWTAASYPLAGVLGLAAVGMFGVWLAMSPSQCTITLEVDDAEIVISIFPPVSGEEAPEEFAKRLARFKGEPARINHYTESKQMKVPPGKYWFTAELDEKIVHYELVNVDRSRTVYIPWAAEFLKKERRRLQGAWRAVSCERDGATVSRAMIDQVNFGLRFDGDRVSVRMEQTRETKQTDKEGAYTLDPRKKPATLDLTDAFDGKTMLCVYRWEGDTLRLCSSPRERPSDFTTKPGSDRMLFVLQKETSNDNGRSSTPPLALAPFDANKAKEHQDAWAKHLGVDVEITNSIGMKLRLIPPGEFDMGSSGSEIKAVDQEETQIMNKFKFLNEVPWNSWLAVPAAEGPSRRVKLTRPYYVGAQEVTWANFKRFVDATGYQTECEANGVGGFAYAGQATWVLCKECNWRQPAYARGEDPPRPRWKPEPDQPVTQVTRKDAEAFCAWLSQQDGLEYRLPMEAQWEFACRAGTEGRYSCGDDPLVLRQYAWHYDNNTNGRPKRVGVKKANAFGLVDMHGNVAEWCADWYDEKGYNGAATIDPTGPKTEKPHGVIRGGNWLDHPLQCRSAARFHRPPDRADDTIGFRVVAGNLKAKVAPSAAASFVVRATGAQAEQKFAVLAEAIAAAQSGDTIEIRGDGPFVTALLDLKEKSLTLRAAPGARPLLQLDAEGTSAGRAVLEFQSPLRLEGLELQSIGPDPFKAGSAGLLLTSKKAPLFAVNCRFLLRNYSQTTCVAAIETPVCDFRNCEFLLANREVGVVIDRVSSPKGQVRMENCVQVGDYFTATAGLHLEDASPQDDSYRFTRNTLIGASLFVVHGEKDGKLPKDRKAIHVECTGNVFDMGVSPIHVGAGAKDPKALVPNLFGWQEQGNVHVVKTEFVTQNVKRGPFDGPKTIADWERYWKLEKTGSQVAESIRYRVFNLALMGATRPDAVTPQDFRLLPSSLGNTAGLDGRALGADVDLVGPGKAYDGFTKTPAYHEWRKQTDVLMNGAP